MADLEDVQRAMLTAVTPAELFEAEVRAKTYLEVHPEDRLALTGGFERLAMIRLMEMERD